MMQGGCKALFKKSFISRFCSSQTARLNHRRMFQQVYFAVFFFPLEISPNVGRKVLLSLIF